MLILCSLRLHKWPEWTDPYCVTVREPNDAYESDVTVQDRTCSRCNLVQVRVIAEGDIPWEE